jgi:hypothetical protein
VRSLGALLLWRLTDPPNVPHLFSWKVETLGVARSLGWTVHMRCANGYREGTRSMRRCVYRSQLKGASEAKPTDYFVVMLTGEESMWLPRPLSGAEAL